MSINHECKVFIVERKEKHPNSDELSIVWFHSYPVVVRTDSISVGDLATYIPPDSLVPVSNPLFSFLAPKAKDGYALIRATKIRKQVSFGLLIKYGEHSGDDVKDELGILHYEPVPKPEYGNEKGPWQLNFKYDLASARLLDDELNNTFFVTEKLNGCFVGMVYTKQYGFQVKSRNNFWKSGNEYWDVVTDNHIDFCKKYEGYALFGERVGQVGGYKYGLSKPKFMVFDIVELTDLGVNYLGFEKSNELCNLNQVEYVPYLGKMSGYPLSVLENLANTTSLLDNKTTKEGVVIETTPYSKYKLVGTKYLGA